VKETGEATNILCMSKTTTLIAIGKWRGLFSVQWFEERGSCVVLTILVELFPITVYMSFNSFDINACFFVFCFFNLVNISVISWRSVLRVKETGVPRENHDGLLFC
jgi:hypothetical protein